MKARMAVIRFGNDDVIATSGIIPGHGDNPIVIPDGICAEIGTVHFFTTGRGRYDATADSTTAPGISYLYTAPGEMSLYAGGGNTMTIAGRVTIPQGRFFYYDGKGYTICDPQAHAR